MFCGLFLLLFQKNTEFCRKMVNFVLNIWWYMDIKSIEIADFNYELPDERIAKHPLAERDQCRLLVRRSNGSMEDRRFDEVASLLPPKAVLVYNNTRVINARLRFRKASGATIEIFCLEPVSPHDYVQSFASNQSCSWACFVGNSKRWKEGLLEMPLVIGGHELTLSAERLSKSDSGSVVLFSWNSPDVTFSQIIESAGEIPIPPYLNRSTEDTDSEDYQTVFSRIEGSVAAPTAGLHFTPKVLADVDALGLTRMEVTLHVGAGTFQPVKSATIGQHPMHSEFIAVSRGVIARLVELEAPVVAVGTTSVRTLESLYHLGCMVAEGKELSEVEQWYPYSESHPNLTKAEALGRLVEYLDEKGLATLVASTRIIIAPSYQFHVVEGMITNFHQPQSTLLLLVSAFTGGDWRRMYDHALSKGYRFLSYGDAQLLL